MAKKQKVQEDNWLRKCPIAHRGLHDTQNPENSMGAFKQAVEAGYPFELDVRITKSGDLIVLHDNNTLRMTGIDMDVAQLTKETVSEYHLEDTEYTIPLFEDVLEMVKGRVPILVELKTEEMPGLLEAKTHEILQKYIRDYGGEIALESFNPFSMWKMKRLADADKTSYVLGFLGKVMDDEKRFSWPTRKILEGCRVGAIFKPDFIAYDISDMPHPFLEKKHERGMTIIGWVVTDETDQAWAETYCDNYIFEGFYPERSIS